MTCYPDVPELLERYIEASGSTECWVTVRELREYFQLDPSAGPAFSGFLRKIHYAPFFSFQYKVTRMEKIRDTEPPYRVIRKYLIQKRPTQKSAESRI